MTRRQLLEDAARRAGADGRTATAAAIRRAMLDEFGPVVKVMKGPAPVISAPQIASAICATCGKPFRQAHRDSRYCSAACAGRARSTGRNGATRPAPIRSEPSTPVENLPWRVFFAELPTQHARSRSEAERIVERKHVHYAEIHHPDTGEYALVRGQMGGAGMTLTAFLSWAHNAKPGQRFEYHRGVLATDCARLTGPSVLLKEIRKAAVDAYLTGWFDLVQRRLPDGFSYVIVKRYERDRERRQWFQSERAAERLSPHRRYLRVVA